MAEFVTDLFLVTSKESELGTFILDTTIKGHDGNLYESSWRHKGKRLVGYKKNHEDEYVVTDVTIVTEDKDMPDDYAGVLITKDTQEKGLKKHILCYSRDSRKTASVGVTEIVLINPGKAGLVPAQYTSINEQVNDIQLCFKTEEIPKQKPPQIPARVPGNQPSVTNEQFQNSAQKSPVSAIEGVPFQINAKYDISASNNDPIINSMAFVSVEDITRKYNYSFATERETVSTT